MSATPQSNSAIRASVGRPNLKPLTLCELATTGVEGLESYSPFCLKVHRALKAAGLPYTSRHAMRPDGHRQFNPAGQVPVLLVGEEAVFDSTRILQRLAALAPDAELSPNDPRDRAEAWLWEDYADRALGGFVAAARWADGRNWPSVQKAFFGKAPWIVRRFIAPRIRKRILASLVVRDVLRAGEEALWDEFRRVLDLLEARAPLTGFWVLGDNPSVADVALFGQLHSLRNDLTPWQARELQLRPALTDWLDRVDAATRAPRRIAAPRKIHAEALVS